MSFTRLILIPLLVLAVQSQETPNFTSDSLAVVSILRVNNLDELNVYNVAQVDSSNRRIVGLSLVYAWGCGCIGGIQAENPLWILPDEIGQLTELKYLYLGDTELDAIPEEIGNLTKLEELDIGWSNNLSALPESISRLTNLKKLRLDLNSFESMPGVIFKFKALEELQLNHLNFDSIPADLGNLTNLKSLSIQFAALSSLPDEIGLLTSLLTLTIYETKLASLPPEIGNLISLEHLELFRNQLTDLPGEITAIHSLKYLEISENRLCNVPDSIAIWIEDNLQQQQQAKWLSTQECGTGINKRASQKSKIKLSIQQTAFDNYVTITFTNATIPKSLFIYTPKGQKAAKVPHLNESGFKSGNVKFQNNLSGGVYLLSINGNAKNTKKDSMKNKLIIIH